MEIGIHFNYSERGPGKVIHNLLNGLDSLGVSYVINSEGEKNIILQNCPRLNKDLTNCYLGPNICTLPIDNNRVMSYHSYEKLIVPSDWVKTLYSKWVPEDKILVWPVGIDTEKFLDKYNTVKQYDFLIYFKRRNLRDLNLVVDYLKSLGKSYVVIKYGEYEENYFLECIRKSKFGIVIDNCESQGIAIQEMLSSNLPLLVWDVSFWTDRGDEFKCKSTSVPYWGDSCGEKIYHFDEFEGKITDFFLGRYSPRKFILENLGIEQKTAEILNKIKIHS